MFSYEDLFVFIQNREKATQPHIKEVWSNHVKLTGMVCQMQA